MCLKAFFQERINSYGLVSFPELFVKSKFILSGKFSRMFWNFPDNKYIIVGLKAVFHEEEKKFIVWKVFNNFWKIFQNFWKLFQNLWKLFHNLWKLFQITENLSRQSEIWKCVWKLFFHERINLYCTKSFQNFWNFFNSKWNFYSLSEILTWVWKPFFIK